MKTLELQTRSITGGTNGYPVPEIGTFFYGFENFDKAQEYAKENNGEVVMAHWRDGWSNCESKGSVYLAKTIYDFIDDSRESIVEVSEADMTKIEKKDFDFMAKFDGYESFADFLKTYELTKEDGEVALIEKLKDLEVGFNVYDCVNCCYTNVYKSKEIMAYSDDTHNHRIGVEIEKN